MRIQQYLHPLRRGPHHGTEIRHGGGDPLVPIGTGLEAPGDSSVPANHGELADLLLGGMTGACLRRLEKEASSPKCTPR